MGATKRFDAAGYAGESPAGGAGVPILASIAIGGVKSGLNTVTKVNSIVNLARQAQARERLVAQELQAQCPHASV